MKGINLYLTGFALLALTACQGLFYNRSGQEIRFSASMSNGAMTRTAYSEEEYEVEGKRKERIDWENGDQVTIHLFLDKAPDFFFEQGENEPIAQHTVSDYTVTLMGSGADNDAYKSRGTLSSEATALRWVGTGDNADVVDHWFYSVYPAQLSGWNVEPQDNYSTAIVTFPDLSAQDGSMDYAYMVAAAGPYKASTALENRKKGDGTVNLDYYPMVTTVYVTFDNKSSKTTIPAEYLALSVDDDAEPLAGVYNLKYSGGEGGTLGTITNGEHSISLPKTEADIEESIPFFLIPRTYSARELTIKIGENSYPLNEDIDLLPFHKYNVTVTINENGEAEPPVIDNALAQLIFALLNPSNGSETSWSAFEEFWKKYFGYTVRDPDFLNGFWQDLSKAIAETKFEDMAEKLKELFPGDKLTGLLDYLGELETISVTNSNLPKLSSSELDFSIFKNARTIQLALNESDATVNISGLEHLESFTADPSNKKINLNIKDCPDFKYITIDQNAQLESLSLVRTPYFTEALIHNQNANVGSIHLEDCSTKVTGAIIRIKNQNANPTVTGNSVDNVKIECKNF